MNQQDKDQLQLLAVFYYIVAGFHAVLALLPVVFMVLGFTALGIGMSHNQGAEAALPAGFFILFGLLFMVFIGGFAYLYYLTGKFLSQQKHWVFCIVIAALTTTSFPIGTILGVFTFVVICRDGVKAAFEQKRTTGYDTPQQQVLER
jgi:hypothetical protein